ncbi:MAG: dienelactone hydrolase family protein [Pseudomonadota bacterium]
MTTNLLDGPRLQPVSGGKAEHLIVLLHGYGADGNDLIGLASHWQSALPNAVFVSPNAPEPCAMNPFGGRQWFPLTLRDTDEYWRGVQSAAPSLNAFLDAELKKHNLTDEKLGLVGFSQGTMMALHVGLRRTVAPGAIVGYSGLLAGPEHLQNEIKSRPPVYLIHGDQDDVIPVAALPLATKALQDVDINVQTHIAQGIGHGIDETGLQLAGKFLAEKL